MSILDQPVTPGIGPEGLPTPALPDQQPVTPGIGPEGLPTPSLPGPSPSVPVRRCPVGYRAGTVRDNQTFTDLLIANDVSYTALAAANPNLPTTRLSPGTRYCAPPAQSRRLCQSGAFSYILSLDEDLFSLSQILGVAPGVLLTANPMLAPSDFIPGRVICIP